LQAQAKKLQDKYEVEACKQGKVVDARDKAYEKFHAHWNPKVAEVDKRASLAYVKVREANEALKGMRRSLIASDNPDRKELIDIFIKD
jgi:hypothetical protein